MLNNKKGFAVILTLVMLLAMASGAWAATAKFDASGVANSISDASGDVNVSGDTYGIWARRGASILYTGGGTITTSGDTAYGAFSQYTTDGVISSVDLTGNIVTHGPASSGFHIYAAYGEMKGDITTYGKNADGLNMNRSTGVFEGNITTYGDDVEAVLTYMSCDLTISGNLAALGNNSAALVSTHNSTATMTGGSLTVADNGTSYAMRINEESTVNLEDVTSEGEKLLKTLKTGTLNASGSTLTGDILHEGADAGTLGISLVDGSSLTGSIEASGDVGTIDINLEESAWIVTGDSDTNGNITADLDSVIDFNGTDENITVAIDNLTGEPTVEMKIGDEFIIKNPASIPVSSNPDVVEVVVNPDDSISIISKGDGNASLTYQYVDKDGKIQTGTIGITSGAGSEPQTYSGGSSSNCNAGLGLGALLSLLGLAVVQKRK